MIRVNPLNTVGKLKHGIPSTQSIQSNLKLLTWLVSIEHDRTAQWKHSEYNQVINSVMRIPCMSFVRWLQGDSGGLLHRTAKPYSAILTVQVVINK